MQTIPTEFTERNYIHRQIARKGNVAIFHRAKSGGTRHYELVRIQVKPAGEVFGKKYPEREVYPGAEEWGTNGFTIVDKDRALSRFNEMAATI